MQQNKTRDSKVQNIVEKKKKPQYQPVNIKSRIKDRKSIINAAIVTIWPDKLAIILDIVVFGI